MRSLVIVLTILAPLAAMTVHRAADGRVFNYLTGPVAASEVSVSEPEAGPSLLGEARGESSKARVTPLSFPQAGLTGLGQGLLLANAEEEAEEEDEGDEEEDGGGDEEEQEGEGEEEGGWDRTWDAPKLA